MDICEVFAQIQANPFNTQAYRRIIDYYEQQQRLVERDAFQNLLNHRYGPDRTTRYQEQRLHDQQVPTVDPTLAGES